MTTEQQHQRHIGDKKRNNRRPHEKTPASVTPQPTPLTGINRSRQKHSNNNGAKVSSDTLCGNQGDMNNKHKVNRNYKNITNYGSSEESSWDTLKDKNRSGLDSHIQLRRNKNHGYTNKQNSANLENQKLQKLQSASDNHNPDTMNKSQKSSKISHKKDFHKAKESSQQVVNSNCNVTPLRDLNDFHSNNDANNVARVSYNSLGNNLQMKDIGNNHGKGSSNRQIDNTPTDMTMCQLDKDSNSKYFAKDQHYRLTSNNTGRQPNTGYSRFRFQASGRINNNNNNNAPKLKPIDINNNNGASSILDENKKRKSRRRYYKANSKDKSRNDNVGSPQNVSIGKEKFQNKGEKLIKEQASEDTTNICVDPISDTADIDNNLRHLDINADASVSLQLKEIPKSELKIVDTTVIEAPMNVEVFVAQSSGSTDMSLNKDEINTTVSTSGGLWRRGNGTIHTDSLEGVRRHVKSLLNKITVEKFTVIAEKLALCIEELQSVEELEELVKQVLDKAITEPDFSEMYADLCQVLKWRSPLLVKENKSVISFSKALLIRCEYEFKNLPKNMRPTEEEIELYGNEELVIKYRKLKVHVLGIIRLIGELFIRKMFPMRSLNELVFDLVMLQEHPDEYAIECLCQLIMTTGYYLDSNEKSQMIVDQWFGRLKELQKSQISTRLNCLIQDVFDLRKHKWVKKVHKQKAKAFADILKDIDVEDVLGGAAIAAQYGSVVVVGERSNLVGNATYSNYMTAQEELYISRQRSNQSTAIK
ncbi:Mif4g domain-containing protein [Cryptosporidium andersoni]|uniref:Mif4g domain-containing protein n=1 Tax=Cryptosporidium andersoni TaxID=117008 RepID=A0A1J4MNW9_9CRYT|nr:Mif4g domain-containing protein [Cryptosporidium andersoni]